MFYKIGDVINRLVRVIAASSLALLLIVVLMQVGRRQFVGSGFPWANEVATYLLVWAVSLGAAYAFWERTHLAVDFVLERMEKFRKALEFFIFAVTYLFLGVFGYFGWMATLSSMTLLSPAGRIPLGWVYLALPVSCLIAIVNITLVIATKKPAPSVDDELESEIEEVFVNVADMDGTDSIIESPRSENTGDDTRDDGGEASSGGKFGGDRK